MKINWKLIVFDFFLLLFIGVTFYNWDQLDNFKKFMYSIMGFIFIIQQVERHISFYKKENKIY